MICGVCCFACGEGVLIYLLTPRRLPHAHAHNSQTSCSILDGEKQQLLKNISEVKNDIKSTKKQISEWDTKINAKEKRIQSLREETSDLKNKIKSKNDTINSKTEEVMSVCSYACVCA